MAPRLRPVRFDDLVGFESDDGLAAFAAFARSARALCDGAAPTRPARVPSPRLVAIAREALGAEIRDAADARRFFAARFQAFRVDSEEADGKGFLTGYYEPLRQGFADANGGVHRADPARGPAISSPFPSAPRPPASIRR